eukprot:2091579-Pleurochrysis_carterae.AAC.1
MHKSADVERQAETRTARRCACARGACTKVPSGGQSHAPLDVAHARKAHAQNADVERRQSHAPLDDVHAHEAHAQKCRP